VSGDPIHIPTLLIAAVIARVTSILYHSCRTFITLLFTKSVMSRPRSHRSLRMGLMSAHCISMSSTSPTLHLPLSTVRRNQLSVPVTEAPSANEVASDFIFGEYITVAIAKVWSGTGKLPSISEMWRIYKQRVEDRGGYTPTFNFM